MLDELGNLQSEGHGIANFQTMLSIGLGQEQQFTLILQTLQQLRDVYGDSVDKIVQGNTSNIVFLKSTDDSMLDTLQKMSGTTHRVFSDQRSVTRDLTKLFMPNEGKLNITMNVKEMPVISYNDMAFISERNSIVFRAGDSPIWNRNQTILPMSWRLFSNTITKPGADFSLQTIPTLSSAMDFDVRKNQPNFEEILMKRCNQALKAKACQEAYQAAYGYSDYDIAQLDPDDYADEIMDMINMELNHVNEVSDHDMSEEELELMRELAEEEAGFTLDGVVENKEQIEATAEAQAKYEAAEKSRYAGGMISRNDLVSMSGSVNHQFDSMFMNIYTNIRGDMQQDSEYFLADEKHDILRGLDGVVYIRKCDESDSLRSLNEAAKDAKSRVYAEKDVKQFASYEVTDAFYRFLVGLDKWDFANGKFEKEAARRMISD